MTTNTDSALKMPKPPARLPLTLIVAATPSLGIGANGALPWRLKAEMQYFARVTTRLPTAIKHPARAQNAVIMGRKTWESIPKKFRPLKGRLNVVLSSQGKIEEDDALWCGSLTEAVELLTQRSVHHAEEEGADWEQLGDKRIARAFIIGGSAVYKAALELPNTERVLLTKVQGDHWGCDTFFSVQLEGEEGEKAGWKQRDNEALSWWVAEDVPKGLVKEGDVEFEYCMYEKGDIS
jgi:dihydrofolate reductase